MHLAAPPLPAPERAGITGAMDGSISWLAGASLAGALLLSSCVAPRQAPPTPAPAPAAPAPAPAPVASDRFQGDWSVADLGPGDWRYARDGAASQALFVGAAAAPNAILRCSGGQISLIRQAVVPADMPLFLTVRTSFGDRQLPLRMVPGAGAQMMGATLPAADPLWDQILYSRGRFVIEATRNAPLLVPTRPELSRVVEDCRG